MIEKIRLIKFGIEQIEVKGRKNAATYLGCLQELDELEEMALEQQREKKTEGGGIDGQAGAGDSLQGRP